MTQAVEPKLTDRQKAVELLREFANYQGVGMRGIVRMQRMQLQAITLLERIDRKKKKA